MKNEIRVTVKTFEHKEEIAKEAKKYGLSESSYLFMLHILESRRSLDDRSFSFKIIGEK